MPFYNKKLTSIDDLKKEQQLIREQLDKFDIATLVKPQIFNTSNLKPTENNTVKAPNSKLESFIALIPAGGVLTEILKGFVTSDTTKQMGANAMNYAIKKVALPVAKEVIGGYLKWKLVEISVKIARKFLSAKKRDTKVVKPTKN